MALIGRLNQELAAMRSQPEPSQSDQQLKAIADERPDQQIKAIADEHK